MTSRLWLTVGGAIVSLALATPCRGQGTGIPGTGIGTGATNPGIGTTTGGNQTSGNPGFGQANPQDQSQATKALEKKGQEPALVGRSTTLTILASDRPSLGPFVGADTTDAYHSRSANPTPTNANQGANQQGNRNNANRNNASQTAQGRTTQANQANRQGTTTAGQGAAQAKPAIRAALRPEIALRPTATAAYNARYESRLSRLPALQRMRGVQVRVDGRTAILTGQVNSKRDAEMLAKLALMEAGISKVDNRLSVAPKPESSSP